MKIFIQIVLIALPLISMGQQRVCVYEEFKVIGNDTINRTINNLKEGKWIDYEVAFNSIQCFTDISCYHQEGIRYIKSKGEYNNGTKVGEWNLFYKTGELKQIDIYSMEGQKNGLSIEYFKNSKIKSEHNWENDTLNSQTVYHSNGNINYESIFENKTLRTFKIYYETGELKFKGSNVIDWKIEQLHSYEIGGKERKVRQIRFGELLANEGLIEYL